MSGTGGEPRPDMSKVEGPILLDRMGGEALQRPNAPPQSSQKWEENLTLARTTRKTSPGLLREPSSAHKEDFTRTPTGAEFRPQERLHPDSYGSRVSSTRKTSPGLLREPGFVHKEDSARTPTGVGFHPLRKGDFTRTPTGAGFCPRCQERLSE